MSIPSWRMLYLLCESYDPLCPSVPDYLEDFFRAANATEIQQERLVDFLELFDRYHEKFGLVVAQRFWEKRIQYKKKYPIHFSVITIFTFFVLPNIPFADYVNIIRDSLPKNPKCLSEFLSFITKAESVNEFLISFLRENYDELWLRRTFLNITGNYVQDFITFCSELEKTGLGLRKKKSTLKVLNVDRITFNGTSTRQKSTKRAKNVEILDSEGNVRSGMEEKKLSYKILEDKMRQVENLKKMYEDTKRKNRELSSGKVVVDDSDVEIRGEVVEKLEVESEEKEEVVVVGKEEVVEEKVEEKGVEKVEIVEKKRKRKKSPVTKTRPKVQKKAKKVVFKVKKSQSKPKPKPKVVEKKSPAKERKKRKKKKKVTKVAKKKVFKKPRKELVTSPVKKKVKEVSVPKKTPKKKRKRKKIKPTPETVPVKINLAAILREESLFKKKQEKEKELLRKYEFELRDSSEYEEWREREEQRDEIERRLRIQELKEKMKGSDLNAQIQKMKAEEENFKMVQQYKKELKKMLDLEAAKKALTLKQQRLKALRMKYEISQKRQKKVEDMEEEKKVLAIQVRNLRKKNEIIVARNIELEKEKNRDNIQKIRASLQKGAKKPKKFDPTEKPGNFLLSEMSYIEMKKRLGFNKTNETERNEQKREEIQQKKKKKQEKIISKMEKMREFRKMAASERKKAREKRELEEKRITIEACKKKDDGLENLYQKLKEKRNKMLATQRQRLTEEKNRKKKSKFYGTSRHLIEKEKYRDLQMGKERSIRNKQELSKIEHIKRSTLKDKERKIRKKWKKKVLKKVDGGKDNDLDKLLNRSTIN